MSSLLNTTTSNAHQEKNSTPTPLPQNPYSITKKDILQDPTITNAEFRVYSVINSYCGNSGMCFISDDALEEEYSWLQRENFGKICKSLSDKGFIYRIQVPIHRRGSRRTIVTACHYDKYVKHQRSLGKFKAAAKVQSFFTGDSQDLLLKLYSSPKDRRIQVPTLAYQTTTPTPRRGLDPNATLGSIINYVNKREESQLDDLSGGISFDEKVKKRCRELGLDWQKAKKLLQICAEEIKKAQEPLGWVIGALKKGYADERLRNYEEGRRKKQAISEAQEEAEKRKELGIQRVSKTRLALEKSGRTDISISFDDIGWRINFYGKGAGPIVPWKERDSIERLEKCLVKENIKIT